MLKYRQAINLAAILDLCKLDKIRTSYVGVTVVFYDHEDMYVNTKSLSN